MNTMYLQDESMALVVGGKPNSIYETTAADNDHVRVLLNKTGGDTLDASLAIRDGLDKIIVANDHVTVIRLGKEPEK